MQLTSLLQGRLRVGALLLRAALVIALTTGSAGCTSGDTSSTETTTEATLVPDETAVAPGACDPTENLAPPAITTAGETTFATLGIGDFGCGGLNGDGYITFNYNPVLIEGEDEGAIEVSIGEGVTAAITWAGDVPFTESSPGEWRSSLLGNSCTRLSIALASESGSASATYGADIRVGGDGVDCPQREVDPSDPSDGDADVTSPPPPVTTAQRTTNSVSGP